MKGGRTPDSRFWVYDGDSLPKYILRKSMFLRSLRIYIAPIR